MGQSMLMTFPSLCCFDENRDDHEEQLQVLYGNEDVCQSNNDLNELHQCWSRRWSTPIDLLRCVNATNTRRFTNLQQTSHDQPICLLTRVTTDITDYAAYSYFVQSIFASCRGYVMLPLLPDSERKDYQYHRKLVPILETMLNKEVDCKFVVWFDAGRCLISFQPHVVSFL
eukprot:scaffold743_cov177-Ochromonas_danica.AAC.10